MLFQRIIIKILKLSIYQFLLESTLNPFQMEFLQEYVQHDRMT